MRALDTFESTGVQYICCNDEVSVGVSEEAPLCEMDQVVNPHEFGIGVLFQVPVTIFRQYHPSSKTAQVRKALLRVVIQDCQESVSFMLWDGFENHAIVLHSQTSIAPSSSRVRRRFVAEQYLTAHEQRATAAGTFLELYACKIIIRESPRLQVHHSPVNYLSRTLLCCNRSSTARYLPQRTISSICRQTYR